MPNNPLTEQELYDYGILRSLTPPAEVVGKLSPPYFPAGYFLVPPHDVDGPVLWRKFHAGYISEGLIDPNRLGTGVVGDGNLYLADDGTWKPVSSGGGSQNLQEVTDLGNVTTNTIETAGTKSDYFLLDTLATPIPQQGMLFWDEDRSTVGLQMNGVEARLGQDNFWYVKNQTGSPISKGTAVMAVGALGASSRILVAPMIADGSVEAKYFLGITAEEILDGEDGFVTNIGKIRGIDTSVYGTQAGQILYCDPANPGGLTITQPAAPNLDIAAAFTVDYKSNGTLAVRALPGYELNELHDVYINTPSTGQLLRYNTNRWENWTPNFLTTVPTLDQVTTAGNTTTNTVNLREVNIQSGSIIYLYRTDNSRKGKLYTDNTGTWLESDAVGNDPVILHARGGSATIDFQIGTLTKMRLSGAANLLIGTTTDAGYKLDVNGTARVSGNLTVDTNTLFVDAVNNKVGIGTTTPTAPLHVNGPSTGSVDIFKITKDGGSTSYLGVFSNTSNASNFDPAFLGYHGSGGNIALQFIGGMDPSLDNSSNLPLVSFQARKGSVAGSIVSNRDLFDWNNYGTSLIRIKATGNVLINTTTDSGHKLRVQGTVSAVLTNATHTSQVYYDTTTGELTYGALPTPATPTLDQVTTAGNTSSNPIVIGATSLPSLGYDTKLYLEGSGGGTSGRTNFSVKNTNTTSAASFQLINSSNKKLGAQISGPSYAIGEQALFFTQGTIPIGFMTDGGVSSGGTSRINFYAGGYNVSPTMTITPGNTGNVLIGTTTDAGYKLDVNGTARVTSTLTANSFVKTGGTSSQFLKADGSVDSNVYLTSYTETDTLDSVTSRGNTTSNDVTVSTHINLKAFNNSTISIGNNNLTNFSSGGNVYAYGTNVLSTATMATESVAFGDSALRESAFSYFNVAIGTGAGRKVQKSASNLTIGGGNVLIGVDSGASLDLGSNNLFIGLYSGFYINSNDNIAIGAYSGGGGNGALLTGRSNIFFGISAGRRSTGQDNIFIGEEVGLDSTKSNWFILGNRNNAGLIEGNFSTGNVLIGTNTDNGTNRLQVNGSISATGGTSTQWNEAYSWGDHALVGYLTSYTETDTLDSVVTRGNTTTQTMSVGPLINSTGSFNSKLELSGEGGFHSSKFTFNNQGRFIAGQVSVFGTDDLYFQAAPFTTSGYGVLEGWKSAGLILSTGGNTSPIIFAVNRIEDARISPTGNLLIGTTVDSSYKLDVNGVGRFTQDSIINGVSFGRGKGATPGINHNVVIGVNNLDPTYTIDKAHVVIGYNAGNKLTGGYYSTMIGGYAMKNATTPDECVAVGFDALGLATTANYEVAVGNGALFADTTGYGNTSVGAYSTNYLDSALGGYGANTVLGAYAAHRLRNAQESLVIGFGAMYSTNTNTNLSAGNIAIGYYAGAGWVSGSYNTWLGYYASGFRNGSYNTIIGGNIDIDAISPTYNLDNSVILADGNGSIRFYSPSSGNVLLGTTTDAGYKLDVNGTARISGITTLGGVIAQRSDTNEAVLQVFQNPSASSNMIISYGDGYLGWKGKTAAGANRWIFESSPNNEAGRNFELYLYDSNGANGVRTFRATRTLFSTISLDVAGTVNVSSSVTANSFIKSGGTSSQFLKADGSIDNNVYQTTSGSVATWTTARTFTIGNTGKLVNGSADVSWTTTEIGAEAQIPVNTIYNYLTAPTVREVAVSHKTLTNKFRFIAPTSQEESVDGVTWNPSSRATAAQLGDLMRGEGEGTSFIAIPGGTVGTYGGYRLTWNVLSQTDYVILTQLYLYHETKSNDVSVLIERFSGGTWSVVTGPHNVSNWPGHSTIPHTPIAYSIYNAAHATQVRITFSTNRTNSNEYRLENIEWYGTYGIIPTMTRRNVESYDRNKNATFPAGLRANNLLLNTTTPSGYLLDVNGSGRVLGKLQVTGGSINASSVNANANDANNYVNQGISKVYSTNNALYIGASSVVNDRRTWIQSGHESTAYANSTGTISLNPLGGNVGIGIMTPTTTLDVNGGGRFGSGSETTSIGAAGIYMSRFYSYLAPSVHNSKSLFLGDVNAGVLDWALVSIKATTTEIFSTTARIVTGGLERFRVNSSGNIGIATNDPRTRLHVGAKVADDNVYSYDSNALMVVHQTPTSSTVLNDPKEVLILARQGTSGQAFGAAAAFDLSRYQNSSTSSRTRLDIRLANNNFLNAGQNTVVMTMLSSGNVGINVATPSERLEVAGNIKIGNGTGLITDLGPLIGRYNSSQVYIATSGYSIIQIGRADGGALNVLPGGNVLIGTSTDSGFKLNVNGTARIVTDLYVQGNVGVGTTSPTKHLTINKSNANLEIRSTAENQTASLYFATPFAGVAPPKAAIIAEGENTWSRSKLHFCLQNTADNSAGAEVNLTHSRMVITKEGNVGIGTTTPISALEIFGNLQRLSLRGAATDYSAFNFYLDNATGAYIQSTEVGAGTVLPIIFTMKAVEKMRITSTGNVGIGNTNPTSTLTVTGDGYFSSTLKVGGGTSNGRMLEVSGTSIVVADFRNTGNVNSYIDIIGSGGAAGQMRLGVFGSNIGITYGADQTPDFVINSSTNIGIGNLSPVSKLHVTGGSSNWNEATPGVAVGTIHLSPASTDNFGNAITFGASDTGSGNNAQAGIYTRSDSTYGTKMYFATTDSYASGSKTRMFIGHDGKVGIGTTSPLMTFDVYQGNTSRFTVDTSGGYTAVWLNNTTTGGLANANFYSQSGDKILYINRPAGQAIQFREANGGTSQLYIGSGGNVGVGTNAPSQKLDVIGNIATNQSFIVNTTSATQGLFITANNPRVQLIDTVGGSDISYMSNTNGDLNFGSNWNFNFVKTGSATSTLKLTNTQNVLIGTNTDSGYKLDVTGDIRSTNIISAGIRSNYVLNTASLYVGHNSNVPNFASIVIDPNEPDSVYYKLVIQANGSWANPMSMYSTIGGSFMHAYSLNPTYFPGHYHGLRFTPQISLGTITPAVEEISAGLFINATGNEVASVVRFTTIASGQTSTRGAVTGLWAGDNFRVWNYEDKDINFGTNNLERLTIKNNGNVLMGTTADNGLGILQVEGNVTASTYYSNGLAGWSGVIPVPGNPPGLQNIEVTGGIITNVF